MNKPFSATVRSANTRVVIGMLQSQYIHSGLAPWCLAAGIRRYATALTPLVCESTVNRPVEAFVADILSHEPAVVGLCCYIWNITLTEQAVRLLKAARPQLPIVLGGPEVSYCTGQVFRRLPEVDAIISGEGELPFALLCESILTGNPVPDNLGIALPGMPEPASYTPCGDWPSPYSDDYFSALKGRIAYLETSRGCPFRCAFCLSGRCGGVRFLPMDRVKKELCLLAHSGTQTVKLVDRTFNANAPRAREIWQFLIEEYGKAVPVGVCFHFEIGGDLLDEESFTLLARAPKGLFQLEIGLQSFYEPTLAAVCRHTNAQRLCANIRRVLAPGNLHIHIDLIAGLPLETFELFAQSFNIAYSLQAHQLQLGFLKLIFGAALRDTAENDGTQYRPQPPYEVLSTRWITADQLDTLRTVADCVDRLYNSGRFRLTLDYLLQTTEQTPFELFCRLAEGFAGVDTTRISLEEYTALLQKTAAGLTGVDAARLRDVMCCDRLASNRTGKLPPCLQITDPAGLKAAAKALPAPPPDTHRGLAILYTYRKIVYCDYNMLNYDSILGRWQLQMLPLS